MSLTFMQDGRVLTVTDNHGAWGKASYSGGGNDCVEALLSTSGAFVRDTQDRSGMLTFGSEAWGGLLAAPLQLSPAAA